MQIDTGTAADRGFIRLDDPTSPAMTMATIDWVPPSDGVDVVAAAAEPPSGGQGQGQTQEPVKAGFWDQVVGYVFGKVFEAGVELAWDGLKAAGKNIAETAEGAARFVKGKAEEAAKGVACPPGTSGCP
jgi:hypothetical protein